MSFDSFHHLAVQFCAAAGTPPVDISPDNAGLLAFSMQLRGVHISVSHAPAASPDHAFVLVMFGAVPADREPAVLRELMHANLLMQHDGAPSFGLNPMDGQVVLQYTCALATASGEELLAGLQAVVDTALQWREGFSLEGTGMPQPPASAAPQPSAGFA